MWTRPNAWSASSGRSASATRSSSICARSTCTWASTPRHGPAGMIASARERTLRSASPEMAILLDALEAGLWVRLGDPDRARGLVEAAEAALAERVPAGGGHGQAMIGAAWGALRLALGDQVGAGQ